MPIDTQSLRNQMKSVVQSLLGPGVKSQETLMYRCPKVDEHTASFAVYEDHFHCFSCGWHGDVISFTMWYYQEDFKASCQRLGAGQADAASLEKVRQERDLQITAENKTRQDARVHYHEAGQWRRFHDGMDIKARDWWENKAIPRDYQDAWMLGYTSDRAYELNGSLMHSSAYVMPMWAMKNGRDPYVLTSQFRLNDAAEGAGRFRFEKGLGTAPFVTFPEWPAGFTSGPFFGLATCLVVEGPRKAATVRSFVDPHIQVIGIPSKGDLGGSLDTLKKYQFVFVILDPDVRVKPFNAPPTWERADIKLCKAIGLGKSAYVSLPDKIDDMLIAGTLTSGQLERRLMNAEIVV